MIHEIENVLHELDKILTEVDIELWQWQSDLDLLSLAGLEVVLVLHKDGDAIGIGEARLIHDAGALTMAAEEVRKPDAQEYTEHRASEDARLAQPYLKEPREPLPLVMYKDGERHEIGFAEYTVLPNGDIVARGEVTAHIPELYAPAPKLSMGYEVDVEPPKPQLIPWAKRVSIPRDMIEGDIGGNPPFEGFENHPFFKKEI